MSVQQRLSQRSSCLGLAAYKVNKDKKKKHNLEYVFIECLEIHQHIGITLFVNLSQPFHLRCVGSGTGVWVSWGWRRAAVFAVGGM